MKKIVSIITLIALFAGCKKYPEDEKLPHFRTPERRLIGGAWHEQSVHSLNTNIGYLSPNSSLRFDKDNTFKGKILFSSCGGECTGTWRLTNKKKNLSLTYDKGSTIEYTILQLDNKVLKFKRDSLEYTFTPPRFR